MVQWALVDFAVFTHWRREQFIYNQMKKRFAAGQRSFVWR